MNAPDEAPKLCINCEHCSMPPTREADKARCFAPENVWGTNPVDGSMLYKFATCKDARSGGYLEIPRDAFGLPVGPLAKSFCGPAGIWFRPREPKPAAPPQKPDGKVDLSSILGDLDL